MGTMLGSAPARPPRRSRASRNAASRPLVRSVGTSWFVPSGAKGGVVRHVLESYRDYENGLPRGRSYVRHGAVIDIQIGAGKVTALVSGTSTYEVDVTIRSLAPKSWSKPRPSAPGRSTRWSISWRDGCRRRSWKFSSPAGRQLLFVSRRTRSLSSARARTGQECASTKAAALYGKSAFVSPFFPSRSSSLRGVDHAGARRWCRRGRLPSRGRSQAPQGRQRRRSFGALLNRVGVVDDQGRNHQHGRASGDRSHTFWSRRSEAPSREVRGKEPTQVRSRSQCRQLRLEAQGGAQNRK